MASAPALAEPGAAGVDGPLGLTANLADHSQGDSADATGAADTGGELPDCQANADQTACEGVMSCVWLPELGGCIVDCPLVEGEAACMAEVGCMWYGDADGCEFQPVA